MCVRNVFVRLRGPVLPALLFLLVTAAAPASATETLLRPPTSAAVLDPFRPPEGPYGSGNRGIEYDTSPGESIVAAGAGTVVFAGPVAGQLYLTIDHGGGLKSSYSYVEAILVARGDMVEVGEPVGVAGSGFHFGTRIDGLYVDPASLFGVRVINVELVEGDLAERGHQFGDLVERSERLHYLELGRTQTHDGILNSALRVALALGGSAARLRRTSQPILRLGPAEHDRRERGVAAALDAATLLDGPSGSDSSQSVSMAIDSVRALPGRFGVPHESVTGRKYHGSHFHEAVVGSRRPLRSSDPSLEPEDEAIHPRRALRHPHRRSTPDAQPSRVVLRVHP